MNELGCDQKIFFVPETMPDSRHCEWYCDTKLYLCNAIWENTTTSIPVTFHQVFKEMRLL